MPKNEEGLPCTSRSRFTKAVNEETQFPIKWSHWPRIYKSIWATSGCKFTTLICKVKGEEQINPAITAQNRYSQDVSVLAITQQQETNWTQSKLVLSKAPSKYCYCIGISVQPKSLPTHTTRSFTSGGSWILQSTLSTLVLLLWVKLASHSTRQ